jgi:DNA-binding ferritin-like protein (Dps family)
MKCLEKELYGSCRECDFRELIEEEIKKRDIMVSNGSLFDSFVKNVGKANIKVYIVNREVLPKIFECSLVRKRDEIIYVFNKILKNLPEGVIVSYVFLAEVYGIENALREYITSIRKECIEKYLNECDRKVKEYVLRALEENIMPSYCCSYRPKIKVPDVETLISLFTYSFPFGHSDKENNSIVLYLSKKELDLLLPTSMHEWTHLWAQSKKDPSSGMTLDLKIYFEILVPFIKKHAKAELEVESKIRIPGEVVAEFVSAVILEDLGDVGIKLREIRKSTLENVLKEVYEKIKVISKEELSAEFYERVRELKSYLFAYKLLNYEELKRKVREVLEEYLKTH